jgi:hypothetical protein
MARGISVVISGNAAPLRKAIGQANKSLGDMGKGTTLAMGAAAAATTAFAVAAVKAAADDQKQQALLARQLKASAGASDAQVASVERYIDATQRSVAVTDTDLRSAFQSLTVATGDVAKAQDLVNVAINTGAGTNKSAAVVADALSKGYAGNMRALATLSPEVKQAIKNGASFNDIVTILNKNFTGAAAVAANTYAGQMFILRNSIDEAKESIGTALLPVLNSLIPAFVKLANFAGQNAALFGGLGIALGATAVGIGLVKGAMIAFKAAAAIATGVNYALATSFTAVQVSTGIGIATALVGVAAFIKIKDSMDKAAASATNYAGALSNTIDTQEKLNAVIGPVPSRDLATFTKFYADAAAARAAADLAASGAADKQKQKIDALRNNLKNAQSSLRSYVEGIRDSVTSSVSLSSAFSDASDQEKDRSEAITRALQDRKDAYAELNQAKANEDATAYATALNKVADAESAVTAAQDIKTKSYSDIFREQIASAKEFGGNLQSLIKAGLGKAGLAQLLNLGPVAGNAVAKDLLAGTGGLTVGGLNADLASVAAAGTAVGMSIPGVSSALSGSVGNTYQITIQAGVGDPVAIGKEVANVLNSYGAKTGGVPMVVKQPKQKAKRKTSKAR